MDFMIERTGPCSQIPFFSFQKKADQRKRADRPQNTTDLELIPKGSCKLTEQPAKNIDPGDGMREKKPVPWSPANVTVHPHYKLGHLS